MATSDTQQQDAKLAADSKTCGRAGGPMDPAGPQTARISVIIPTLNEAALIREAIQRLRRTDVYEIIVADGMSDDGTPEIAEACGALVVRSERGRGQQLNAGAAIAGGELLLFLHADTALPAGFEWRVRETLRVAGIAAGAFGLRIDGVGFWFRVIERLVRWRSFLFGLPYGDQGLFLTTETFQSVGMYPEFKAMEDFELVRRLGRVGRVHLAPESVTSSSRRWTRRGIFRTTLLNTVCVAAYLSGVSPDRIAVWRSR